VQQELALAASTVHGRGFLSNYRWSSSLEIYNRAQSTIHSVLTTRIILTFREAVSRRLHDVSLDLHLSDTDSRAYRSRTSFAENRVVLYSDNEQMSDTFWTWGKVRQW